jgi:Lar family restriction alleviation protein
MENPEIKACPFCGSDEVSAGKSSEYPTDRKAWVTCHNCYTAGPVAGTEIDAIRYWNDRAGDRQSVASSTEETIGGCAPVSLLAGGRCHDCNHWAKYPVLNAGPSAASACEKGYCTIFDKETVAAHGSQCTAHEPANEKVSNRTSTTKNQ